MRFLLYISRFMIPLVIVYMITFGLLMKRPVYGESRSPIPADPGSSGKIIFFQRSNRAGAGHFQGIRAGFPDRLDGIAAAFLYRNYFLYDESVFYGSRGQKNPLYTSRSADGDSLRDVHEHFNGKSWLFVRKL